MKKTELTKYALDFEKTKSYFIEVLVCGSFLSEKVAATVNLSSGNFSTFLPSSLVVKTLYNFSESIFPIFQKDENWEYRHFFPSAELDLDNSNYTPVASLSFEMSEFISQYLSHKMYRIAIFDHVVAEPGYKFLKIKDVDLTGFNNEVYYIVRRSISASKVMEVIQKTQQIWHFLCVLAAPKHQIRLKQDESDLICEAVDYLIVTAYDGEGFIIWEKN